MESRFRHISTQTEIPFLENALVLREAEPLPLITASTQMETDSLAVANPESQDTNDYYLPPSHHPPVHDQQPILELSDLLRQVLHTNI